MSIFDEVIDRSKTNSSKYSCDMDVLPMWVADMDFRAPTPILDALSKRLENGVLGYTREPKEWSKTLSAWWQRRHGASFAPEWFGFCTGVIPAISTAVRKFTSPGDKILTQTPVYHVFFNCIKHNGREVVKNELVYKNGTYEIDFADFEAKVADEQTTMFLLCNPQNPTGKIFSRDELLRMGELCAKHGVLVVSDEIHCDITAPNTSYTPFASVSEICAQNSITCVAPTKTFNIAGIQSAAVMVPNDILRIKMKHALNSDVVAEGNAFAAIATIAAYTQCDEWLEQLRSYIADNRRVVREFLQSENLGVSLREGDATYLLWLECNQVSQNSSELHKFLLEYAKLWLNDGAIYGGNGSFLRMNIACPRSVLLDGLERLKRGVKAFKTR